ncbi:MAG: hypothetical protein LBH29_05430 [Elusimicrobiota bacterium]|jgi:uncharacterized protein YacL|nr:hypothetical protein [Elusimicrobiota bacterium]
MITTIIRYLLAVAVILAAYFGWASLTISLMFGLFFALLEYMLRKSSYRDILCVFLAAEFGFFLGLCISVVIDSKEAGASFFNIPAETIILIQVFLILLIAAVLISKCFVAKPAPAAINASKSIISETLTADISAFEDGRIFGLLNSNFINSKIIAADFIVSELKNRAQLNDNAKKYKAKRALDIINKLEANGTLIIKDCSKDKEFAGAKDLYSKMSDFALKFNLKILTADFSFAKSAMLQKVKVLNLLELADFLAPIYAPGDAVNVFLSKEGEQSNQALGFLSDGSMIVAEEGKRFIGKRVKLIITSVIQSSTNRIFFAKTLFNDNAERKNNYKRNGEKQ